MTAFGAGGLGVDCGLLSDVGLEGFSGLAAAGGLEIGDGLVADAGLALALDLTDAAGFFCSCSAADDGAEDATLGLLSVFSSCLAGAAPVGLLWPSSGLGRFLPYDVLRVQDRQHSTICCGKRMKHSLTSSCRPFVGPHQSRRAS